MAVRAPLTDASYLNTASAVWKDVLDIGREAIHFEQEAKRLRAENEALTRSLDDVLKDLAEAEGLVGRLKERLSEEQPEITY